MAARSTRPVTVTSSIGQSKTILLVSASMMVTVAGCLAPKDHRQEADQVAYSIIERERAAVLGDSDPFTIETSADTLRRRLLLDQDLPYSSPASLGARYVELIEQWPDEEYMSSNGVGGEFYGSMDSNGALVLTLVDALQLGAHSSREYQANKEQVFATALALDLESDAFRHTWTGMLNSTFEADLKEEVAATEHDGIIGAMRNAAEDALVGETADFVQSRLADITGVDGDGTSMGGVDNSPDPDRETVAGVSVGGELGVSKRLKNGVAFTASIGLDLVSLLTQDRLFSRGVYADASVSIPLMRGSGEFVVTEPLTQAQRDVVYSIYQFERYRRQFAVEVASEYLAVLRQLDSVNNAEDNYRRLIASTRRARRLADAGNLPEIQVDQSRQDELSSRNRWISTQESYRRQLDSFKLTLGLPTDANVELDRSELATLSSMFANLLNTGSSMVDDGEIPPADAEITLLPAGRGDPGRYEIDESEAIGIALDKRLDLRVAVGRVFDAQRSVAVAADQLRADVTLLGTGSLGSGRSIGSVGSENSRIRPDEGVYSALLNVDLPLERTSERNSYRRTLIQFEQAVRDVQALEDQVKLNIRNDLSQLLEARESIQIQAEAVKVARRRVASTTMFLEAGRTEIRDLLEAQDALVTTQNSLTSALVSYRVGELALQRDLGVLRVDHQGLWQEFNPSDGED